MIDQSEYISNKLKYFKLNKTCSDGIMRQYIRALTKYAETPELRAYWTIVYKYINIQL